MDGGLVVLQSRQYAFSVIRKPVCSAVRVFLALQVSRNFREPLTLRSRQRTISALPSWDDFAHITNSATELFYVVMLLLRYCFHFLLLTSHFSLLATHCLTRTACCGTAFTSVLPLLPTAVLRYCLLRYWLGLSSPSRCLPFQPPTHTPEA